MHSSRICVQYRKLSNFLRVSSDVRKALDNGKGVVALESTVITHGLPFPHNLSTARELEEQVKLSGSQPATIALINGKIHVGLEDAELERIAESKNSVKVSTRDIAKALVKKELGGTTVASTMRIANAAGIKVFATGGIGGVHRGADQTFDISADLHELSRTPVCVVCSGVKSILDIPKTIEYLETHSVNCIVFGEENIFPSFFTRKSDRKAQFNTTDFEEVVDLLEVSSELGLQAGTILACPIPEKFAADGDLIQSAIDTALKEASEQSISSQGVTPFILSRVNQLTGGASMKTNIALLKNNARIAGLLSQKLSRKSQAARNFSTLTTKKAKNPPKVVSIGATIVDFEAITHDDIKDDGGSYTGEIVQRMGGVARNHADALARLGCDSILLSAVGDDPNSLFFRQKSGDIDISRVQVINGYPTCTYLSMNFHGNVKYGITNCEPLLEQVSPKLISDNSDVIKQSDFILVDGNLPVPVIRTVFELAEQYGKKVWYEPTDIKKVHKAFDTDKINVVTASSPNANEFLQWAKFCGVELEDNVIHSTERVLDTISSQHAKIMKNLSLLIVSLSQNGTAVVYRDTNGQFQYTSLEAPVESHQVVSVSGAGDSFNSGVIAGLSHGKSVEQCLQIGQECAKLTLQTTLTASELITPDLLK